MLPLAPVCFPLTCPPVAPRGVGATCADADEAASLHRLEHELEVQVRTTRSRVTRFPVPLFRHPRTYVRDSRPPTTSPLPTEIADS